MMVMGPHLDEINRRSVESYAQTIIREDMKRNSLSSAESHKEFYDLTFAIVAFLVCTVTYVD